MKRKTVFIVAGVFLTMSVSADTYYWRGSNTAWSDWTNIADGGWSLARDSYVAPSHVPGTDAGDTLWPFGVQSQNYIGNFNLGGGSYTVAGYSSEGNVPANWQLYQLQITNGTLTVSSFQKPFKTGSTSDRAPVAWRYDVWNGATFNFNTVLGGFDRAYGASGLYEYWYVMSGGRMNLPGPLVPCALDVTVNSGGVLNVADGTFRVNNNSHRDYPNKITNFGTLLLPNGFEWVAGDPWSPTANNSKAMIVTQSAGETRMGGDFKKTGLESHNYTVMMKFVLQGGTLTVEENKSVSFISHTDRNSGYTKSEEVFAEMPASASATVQTLAGSVLDMSLFTYGNGAALTKTGSGTLIMKDRPATVNVTAGMLKLTNSVADLSGVSLSSGTTLEFAQAGNVAAVAPTGYASAVFALDNSGGAFTDGANVISSNDADFLAAVATSLNAGGTVPAGLAAIVSGGAVKVMTPPSHTFTSDGELDLGDASGWNMPGYVGTNVFVSGASTVALISPATPAFDSITLSDGATLKVSGDGIELPKITLLTPSTLLVPGGSSAVMTNGFTAAGDVSGLPVVKVETNGVLTVARGTKFKNCAVKLYGEIGVPPVYGDVKLADDQGIQFGYAAAGETTYFAMESIGGNINVSGNTTVDRQKELTFAWADNGGRVLTYGDILLKDTTFKTPQGAWHYIGKMIGGYNPDDSGIRVVLDNTVLPLRRFNWFNSGTVVCRNGGRLERQDYHAGTDCRLTVDRYTRIECEGEGSGLFLPYANVWRPFYYDIWLDGGVDQFTFRDGAVMAAHYYWGGNHSVLVFSNGVYQVGTLPFVSSDRNPNPPNGDPHNWMTNAFTGAHSVRIERGGKLFFQSASVLSGTEWDRYMTLADKPIKGEGDFVMTNGVPGRGFSATVVCNRNTSTGSISVAPSADPTTLFFNDGANWAGTVVAGNIALTNLTAAASPSTVSFKTLDLCGIFPIRIMDNGGIHTNDVVNISTALTGGGAIKPIVQPGLRLSGGETFVLGTCPAAGVDTSGLQSHVTRNWELMSEDAGGGKVRLLLKYMPRGLLISIR
ncbi:MAG: hypothetical protein IKF72_03295 [Kiritimatiellae bacterium]|nr:hypothetical protein [Kiritimatiellia bacterium]